MFSDGVIELDEVAVDEEAAAFSGITDEEPLRAVVVLVDVVAVAVVVLLLPGLLPLRMEESVPTANSAWLAFGRGILRIT